MLKTIPLLVILLSVCSVCEMDKWSALSMIETGDRDCCVGKAGEISRWQIKRSVWHSNTSLPFSAATSQIQAKTVAERVQGVRIAHFKAVHHREPTNVEFYLLWNCPAHVLKPSAAELERAQRFANLCERK